MLEYVKLFTLNLKREISNKSFYLFIFNECLHYINLSTHNILSLYNT